MKPHSKLKTALFLAAAANMTYASESCFPPKSGQTPLEVLECFQNVQDAQQKRITELEKENQALLQIISVSGKSLELNGIVNQLYNAGNEFYSIRLKRSGASGSLGYPDIYGGGTLTLAGKVSGDGVIAINSKVGIGTLTPTETLEVNGNVKATAFKTGDIFFEKDGQTLWQMFEDENGLYLKQIKTGKTYRLMLEEIQ